MSMPSFTWVQKPQKKSLIVGIADMAASNDVGAELVTHSLGSCLGITLYDPVVKCGGLLHIMLPDSSIDAGKAQSRPLMFVDSGVPRLIKAVLGVGANKARMVVKVAGGARLLNDGKLFNIGERNLTQLVAHLKAYGLRIHAHDTGGRVSRTLKLALATGEVTIHSPGITPYRL